MSKNISTFLLAMALTALIAAGVISTNIVLDYKKMQATETRAAIWGETTALSTEEAEPMVYVPETVAGSATTQPLVDETFSYNAVVPANVFLEGGKAVYMKLDTEGASYGIYADSDLLWSFELDSKYMVVGFCRDDESNTYIIYEDVDKNLFLSIYDESGQAKIQDRYIFNYFYGKYEFVCHTVMHEGALYFSFIIPSSFFVDDSGYSYIMRIDLDSYECKEYINLEKYTFGEAESFAFDSDSNLYVYGFQRFGGWVFIKISPEGKIMAHKHGAFATPGGSGRFYTTIRIVDDYIYLGAYMYIEKFTLDWEYVDTILTMGYDTPFLLTDWFNMHSLYGNFDIDEDKNIALGTFIWNGPTLTRPIYKLTLHPKSSVPEKQYAYELVITAGFRQPFIEAAGARYMVDNQDVKISFDTVYRRQEDYNENYDTAIMKLTTKLLSNDVGDIVAVGGMGVNYYAALNTDIFIDLNNNLVNDKNYSHLNKPDIEGLRIGESLRGLSLGVVNPVLLFNRSLADEIGYSPELSGLKWSDITRMAKEVDSQYPGIIFFNNNSVEENLDCLIIANIPDLVDMESKTYNLQQGWFLELLQDFKEMCRIESHNVESENIIPKMIDDNSLFHRFMFSSYYDLYARVHDMNSYEFLPVAYGEKNRNIENFSRLIYAISDRSSLQQEAWDFLSYLMDYERQSMFDLGAMPLNLTAEEGIISRAEGSEAFTQEISAIRENVDYMFDYTKIRLGIYDPVLDYITGKISLETAIEKAEHNVMLALSE